MNRVPLFRNRSEFLIVSSILLVVVIVRLSILYFEYISLKESPFYYTDAKVIRVYKERENGKRVVKLKTKSNLTLYIYSNYKKLKNFSWVRVKFKIDKKSTFLDYLRGVFVYGEVIEVLEDGFNPRQRLVEAIYSEHKTTVANFYSAIYFAQPLEKSLRDKIAALGISHLIALSGFHLGILWIAVFAFLYLPYRYIHQNFIPWHHRDIDLALLTLIILFVFVIFVGSPPALIRSFVMFLIGYVALLFGIEIVSFYMLAIATLLILVFEPRLIVSIGFLLSISGVFYIFLILKWLKELNRWIVSLIAIPIGLFIFMFPIGHYFFPVTTTWQLSSPIISLIFIIFYPLSAILHILSYPNLFDSVLQYIFSYPIKGVNIVIPNGLMALYLLVSLGAVFSRKLFLSAFFLALIVTLYSIFLT